MMPPTTSMQRVLTTLGHQEPDRVPFFLLLTMHGAQELGLTIREYFSQSRYVIEGQLRLRAKYRHDCYYPFFYAPLEIDAWGGEVIFREDGPPNSGEPFIQHVDQISTLEPPQVATSAPLARVLETIAGLKARMGDEVPIIGVVMSPFSLPVMQLGFDRYLDLIDEQPELFARLMQINETFCVDWANAQLAAGATAICYFDPVSSSTIVPRRTYLTTGFEVARRTLARIHGPTATHFASGRCLPVVADVAQTGTAVIGTSADEDLAEVKAACRQKLTVLGNLNGLEMRHWSPQEAQAATRSALAKAGPGGGFILSDNHGEIPCQVPEETLLTISETVHKWGTYPLSWIRPGEMGASPA